jgi:hypothetical protein
MMDRRNFLFASSGAAAGSLLVPGFVEADEGGKSPYADSGLATGSLKPLRHKEVPGFLSAAQIAPHHTAHYGGALKAFVGADAKFEESFTKGTAIDPHESHRVRHMLRDVGTKPDEDLYPVLADSVNAVSATYGVAFQMGIHTEWSNRPATFVIDQNGVIRYEKRGTTFNDRPKPADILAEIDKLGTGKQPVDRCPTAPLLMGQSILVSIHPALPHHSHLDNFSVPTE